MFPTKNKSIIGFILFALILSSSALAQDDSSPLILPVSQEGDAPYHVTWSPDGRYLARWLGVGIEAASVNRTVIFDTETGEPVFILSLSFRAIHWSPDGEYLAVWHNRPERHSLLDSLEVWHVDSGQDFASFEKQSFIHWSTTSTQIMTSERGDTSRDGLINVWDVETGTQLFSLPGSNGMWSPDETMIATWQGDTIWVADAVTGDTIIAFIGWSNDVIWSPDSSRIFFSAPAYTDPSVSPIAYYPATYFVRDVSTGQKIVEFDMFPPEDKTDYYCYKGRGTGQWHRDSNRFLIVDGVVHIWNAATGQEILTLEADNQICTAYWSPDYSRILTAGNFDGGPIRVWDAETGEQLLVFDDLYLDASWNVDGTHILGWTRHGMAYVWDAIIGGQLLVMRHFSTNISCCTTYFGPEWSPDGTRVAVWRSGGISGSLVIGESAVVKTQDSEVEVWDEPSEDSTLITTLPHDTVITLIDSNNGWLYVQTSDGVEGWVLEYQYDKGATIIGIAPPSSAVERSMQIWDVP
jgi:hypothetical protein